MLLALCQGNRWLIHSLLHKEMVNNEKKHPRVIGGLPLKRSIMQKKVMTISHVHHRILLGRWASKHQTLANETLFHLRSTMIDKMSPNRYGDDKII